MKFYGTKNLSDHKKTCHSGQKTSMNNFVKRNSGKRFNETEKASVKAAQVRVVAEAGLLFTVVDNSAFRHFARLWFKLVVNTEIFT